MAWYDEVPVVDAPEDPWYNRVPVVDPEEDPPGLLDRRPERENRPIFTGNAVLQSPNPRSTTPIQDAAEERVYGIRPGMEPEPHMMSEGRGQPTFWEFLARGPESASDLGSAPTPGQFARGAFHQGAAVARDALGGGLTAVSEILDRQTEPVRRAMGQEGVDFMAPLMPTEQIRRVAGEFGDILGLQAGESQQRVAEERPEDPIAGYLYDLQNGLIQMSGALVASRMTGNPSVGLGTMGTQVAAQTFNEKIQEGMPPEQATNEAILQSLYEVVPEKMFMVFDRFMSPGHLNRLKQALAEGGAESTTEAFNILDEALRQNENVGSTGEVLGRLGYAAGIGAGMGAAIGPSGPSRGTEGRADQAEIDLTQPGQAEKYGIPVQEVLESQEGLLDPLATGIRQALEAGQAPPQAPEVLEPMPEAGRAAQLQPDPAGRFASGVDAERGRIPGERPENPILREAFAAAVQGTPEFASGFLEADRQMRGQEAAGAELAPVGPGNPEVAPEQPVPAPEAAPVRYNTPRFEDLDLGQRVQTPQGPGRIRRTSSTTINGETAEEVNVALDDGRQETFAPGELHGAHTPTPAQQIRGQEAARVRTAPTPRPGPETASPASPESQNLRFRSDGNPYRTERGARNAIARQDLAAEPVEIEGGWAINLAEPGQGPSRPEVSPGESGPDLQPTQARQVPPAPEATPPVAQVQEAPRGEATESVATQEQTTEAAAPEPAEIAGAESTEAEAARTAWREQGTNSPYFRRWFGDSKVVDENGEPLAAYHGSPEPGITQFEPGRREPGTWFTTNRRTAGQYVGMDGDVTSAFLRAENPMVVEFADDMTPMVNGQESDIETNEAFAEYAERQGYDSVHFPEGNFSEDAETWVVFHPTQIKSTTGNVGTFDPDNPDIRYTRTEPGQDTEGMAPDQATEALRGALSPRGFRNLVEAGPVRVVSSPAEVPGTHPADAAGVAVDGEIYLVADNLRDPAHVRAVLLHELGVHHGLREMLGDDYGTLIDQLRRQVERGAGKNPGRSAREAWAAHQRALADDTIQDEDVRWEETVAYLAESGSDTPLLRRILAAIRNFLRRYGLVRKFTAADVAQIARGSVRRAARQEARPAEPAPRAAYARTDDTRTGFESRIEELFSGEPANQVGVKALDASDVLDVLGFGDQPVHIAESKVRSGRFTHGLTAEHWKKIPDWLDNPVAVFDSDTVPGRLVFLAPETVDGKPVVMILEPNADHGSMNVHLLVNAYDKTGGRTPVRRWSREGLMRYGAEKQIPAFNRASGLRLPRVSEIRQGYGRKIYTERDLVKHRRGDGTSPPADPGQGRYSRGRDEISTNFESGPRGGDPKPVEPGKEQFATTVFLGRGSDGKPITLRTSDPSLREQSKLKYWVKRLFTKEGQLTPAAFDRHIESHGIKNEAELDTQFFTADFVKAARRAYGKRTYGAINAADREKMNEYLAGNDVEGLRRPVRDGLDAMRGALDNLSTQLQKMVMDEIAYAADSLPTEHRQTLLDNVNEAANGDEAALETIAAIPGRGEFLARKIGTYATIEGNKGAYLHRSYRVFDDKDWRPDTETIHAAREYLTRRVKESGRFQDLDGQAIADHVDGIINSILRTDKTDMLSFMSSPQLGQKDLSVMKKRKDIAPEIRALMGEYKDPRVNFARSVGKMSYLVANHHFLSKVREDGLGSFLSTEPSGRMSKQITAWDEQTMTPLAGLYATPEFAGALHDAVDGKAVEGWLKWYLRGNTAVKYGKTVLSPTTTARNFMSASLFTVMNGHLDYRSALKAAAHTWADLASSNMKRRGYLKKLVRLGVLHDNPRASELREALNEIADMDTSTSSVPGKIGKGTLNVATKIYRAGDDFWKIIGFENTKSDLMKSGMSETDAEKMAADRVRNGYPTYSMVPESIRMLRRFPLMGTFVSFPWEIIRTTGSQFRFLREDLQAGRNTMAAKRMVGMATAGAISYAIKAATMAMFGIDDEDDEAIRELAAPWQKNAQLAYIGHDENGNIRYIDLSHLDPYAYLKLPVDAILNGNSETVGEKSGEALKEMLEPFLGAEITVTALGELWANKNFGSGGEIYDEHAPSWEKGKQAFEHLRTSLQPGLFSNVERTLKAANKRVASYGKPYSLKDESLAWVGFRITTAEPEISIKFRGFDFNDQKSEANRPVYRKLRSFNPVSKTDMQKAVRSTYRRWRESFEEMHAAVRAARVSGMDDDEIAEVLDNSGVAKKYINPLLEGWTPMWSPSRQTLKNAALSTTTGRVKVSEDEFDQRVSVMFDELDRIEQDRDQ